MKVSLFEIQFVSSQNSPIKKYVPLPSWMSFDYENQVFGIESGKQRQLGSYYLYASSSKQIPRDAFDFLFVSNAKNQSRDLLTTLISLGYMDNQRFLTTSFGLYEDFLLPSYYSEELQERIYENLKTHRIETFTGFNIVPSLELLFGGEKMLIQTQSNNSISVDIKLDQKGQARFLKRIYGDLKPRIVNYKLTIEGPLDAINEALRGMVINLNSSCDGEITINDHLNPVYTETIRNISAYFFHNDYPKENPSHPLKIQQQIDIHILYTGEFFSIDIDPFTFMDKYNNTLTYELIQQDDDVNKDKSLPSWLIFQDLNLKGTAPEDAFKRKFNLILIIRNEFKQIQVPVVLNVKISWLFGGKLLIRYSPYILTIIGLLISASKIYNILCKKRYRHCKNFEIRVGQKITPSVVFPVRFIKEEKVEGEMILKHLKIKNFDDEEVQIRRMIKEVVDEMSEKEKRKLLLYFQAEESGQKRVLEYIRNELIMWRLNTAQEKSTKLLFDKIKENWIEFTEYNNNLHCFGVNENQFNSFINGEDNNHLSESMNETLLSNNNNDVDKELLKKALVVYAIKEHELNYEDRSIEIQVKVQGKGWWKAWLPSLFKLNLKNISYSKNGGIGYGLNYEIQDNTLFVSGTPSVNFEGKVVVIQILYARHQRILKELWLYGVSSCKDRLEYSIDSENEGKSYEVF